MEPKYEIFVRLPFNRGDFVDPPPVDWNDSKSDALWNIINDVERTERKIDWNELATSFGVGVDFLLMMAQTLAERHTNQLMGLFRKAAATTSASGTASLVNPLFPAGTSLPDASAGVNSESMRRTASGSGNRPASPSSIRRDSPLPRADHTTTTSGAGTPLKTSLTVVRPPAITSRSATPTVLSQNLSGGASAATKRPNSSLLPRHRPSNLQLSSKTSPPPPQHHSSNSPDAPSSPAKSDSSASSSDSSSPVESRIIKRPPRSLPKRQGQSNTSLFPDDDDEDEEEAEPAFLPYHSPPAASAGSSDLGATLRGAASGAPSRRPGSKAAATAFLSSREGSALSEVQGSHTSDESSNSSAAAVGGHHQRQGRGGSGAGRRQHPHGGPLSPRRTAELSGRSPAGKGKGREGSDGTPSMGSSFSDLDDASVTQSALEEALASNMQDGAATVGSRMSTFGNAFKSRYLPKGNR